MLLRDYLERERISTRDFARRLGHSAEAVRLYAAGRRIPRPDIMAKLVRLTHGEVQPNDFFPTPARKRKAA